MWLRVSYFFYFLSTRASHFVANLLALPPVSGFLSLLTLLGILFALLNAFDTQAVRDLPFFALAAALIALKPAFDTLRAAANLIKFLFPILKKVDVAELQSQEDACLRAIVNQVTATNDQRTEVNAGKPEDILYRHVCTYLAKSISESFGLRTEPAVMLFRVENSQVKSLLYFHPGEQDVPSDVIDELRGDGSALLKCLKQQDQQDVLVVEDLAYDLSRPADKRSAKRITAQAGVNAGSLIVFRVTGVDPKSAPRFLFSVHHERSRVFRTLDLSKRIRPICRRYAGILKLKDVIIKEVGG